MYSYTFVQWLFFFYLYCFLGWCVESAYVSITTRKLTNRGFLRGPFLPLYGSGATMMLVVSIPFQEDIAMTYVAGCIGATALEYVTGVAMEALFKMRYWDYSTRRFNFQGRICLGTTLAWGLLTIVMTEVVHVPVEALVFAIPGQALTVVTIVLSCIILADFVLSFKAAIDLRNVLFWMEQAKEEMVRIQTRLDAIVAAVNQGVSNVKEGWAESMAMRIEDVKSGIEGRLESLKNVTQTKPTEYLESVKEEIAELKTKYAVNLALRNRLSGLKDFFQRDMIRSNPGMTSERFKEALEELKQKVSGRKDE